MSENKKIENTVNMITEAQFTKIKELMQEQNYMPAPTDEKLLKYDRKRASDFIKFLLDSKSLATCKDHNKDKGNLFNESLFHMCRASARDIMLHFGKDPTAYPQEYEFYIREMYKLDTTIKQGMKESISKGVF